MLRDIPQQNLEGFMPNGTLKIDISRLSLLLLIQRNLSNKSEFMLLILDMLYTQWAAIQRLVLNLAPTRHFVCNQVGWGSAP